MVLVSIVALGFLTRAATAGQPSAQVPVDLAGPVSTLDADITGNSDFVLEEGTTLVITEDRKIETSGSIFLRGTVRVELPEDAPQGAWAPQLFLIAGERIVITGPMIFGDGRDGFDEGVMGGSGASMALSAPLVAIGVHEVRMGDGGNGGPGVEGGPGGYLELGGWVLPFHPDGLVLAAGDGGDGGDGSIGTQLHPRGHRGGNGGDGGICLQINPVVRCLPAQLPGYLKRATGTNPVLDPYLIGAHRILPSASRMLGGNGGNGGDGGLPFPPMAGKTGGGDAGNGGNGGSAAGLSGFPGTAVTPADEPPSGTRWTGGTGSPGGDAYGGDGGIGGNSGPSTSPLITPSGGRGGDGGNAFGGRGGDAGTVNPPKRYRLFEARVGQGGNGTGGNGGNGGNGHKGGDAGDGGNSTRGDAGEMPKKGE